jgi:hypothetical protein
MQLPDKAREEAITPLPEKMGSEAHEMTLLITGLAQNELLQRVSLLETRIGARLDALEDAICIDIVRTAPRKYNRRFLWPCAAVVCTLAGLGILGGSVVIGETITIKHEVTVNLQQAGLSHAYRDSRGVGMGRSPPNCIARVCPPRVRIVPEPIP